MVHPRRDVTHHLAWQNCVLAGIALRDGDLRASFTSAGKTTVLLHLAARGGCDELCLAVALAAPRSVRGVVVLRSRWWAGRRYDDARGRACSP